MLKFRNPYFKPAAQAAREASAAALAPQIDTWLKTQTNNKVITLAELKTGVPTIPANIDRETLNMIVELLNITLENPDDQTP